MDAQEILHLLDSFWFQNEILFSSEKKLRVPITPNHKENPVHEIEEEPKIKVTFSNSPSLQVRSVSDHCLISSKTSLSSFFDQSFSPNSVLNSPRKLQTILSGKEVTEVSSTEEAKGEESEEKEKRDNIKVKFSERRKRNGKRRLGSKSLTELEFEELKGFMDLGFVFSEEDKESTLLVSIIPGLKKPSSDVDKKEEEEKRAEGEVGRKPYLSEAWEVFDKRSVLELKMIPGANFDQVNMKDQLRFWAHTVASTVR